MVTGARERGYAGSDVDRDAAPLEEHHTIVGTRMGLSSVACLPEERRRASVVSAQSGLRFEKNREVVTGAWLCLGAGAFKQLAGSCDIPGNLSSLEKKHSKICTGLEIAIRARQPIHLRRPLWIRDDTATVLQHDAD